MILHSMHRGRKTTMHYGFFSEIERNPKRLSRKQPEDCNDDDLFSQHLPEMRLPCRGLDRGWCELEGALQNVRL